MSDSFGRPVPIQEHPLVDREYRLPTPIIEAFYSLVTDALDQRRPGITVYGSPRLGKTTAIEYLEALLKSERPNLPIIVLGCRFKRVPSETAFFSALLHTVRHKATSGRDSEALRQRLVQKLCEMADGNRNHQILMFADEAQNLGRAEYEWLRDLHDDLHRWRKTLLVVLVGQPELKSQKATFQRDGSQHIVSRFMVHEMAFRGICSAAECATCLQGYDLQEYPADSGWPHTRFFLPRAHRAGFRLALEGSALWYAFEQAHARTLLPQKPEIGMQFFTAAAEHVLISHARHDSAVFKPSLELWSQAVKNSGYVEAMLSEVLPTE
jgi:hypothetical protein